MNLYVGYPKTNVVPSLSKASFGEMYVNTSHIF